VWSCCHLDFKAWATRARAHSVPSPIFATTPKSTYLTLRSSRTDAQRQYQQADEQHEGPALPSTSSTAAGHGFWGLGGEADGEGWRSRPPALDLVPKAWLDEMLCEVGRGLGRVVSE